MSNNPPLSQRGLTRLEALLMVMIIGLIVIIALPKVLGSEAKTKKQNHTIERRSLNTKINLYRKLMGSWPLSVSELGLENNTPSVSASQLSPNAPPNTCIFGARWQIDPQTKEISLEGHRFHE